MTTQKHKSLRIPRTALGRRGVSGVGLIEILIAVAILAFGLLGIAALQATTLRTGQSSLERSTAVMETYGILDRMRANVDVARIGNYNLTRTCDVPDAGDQAATDLHEWITELQDRLGPDACGTITCGSLTCTVTVDWDDSRGNLANEARPTLTTVTRL